MIENIKSFIELKQKIAKAKKSYALLYKTDNDKCICAYDNLRNAVQDNPNVSIFAVDVTNVRDVHGQYGITSVPALLLFEENNIAGVIKGCHEPVYYKSLISGEAMGIKPGTGNEKKAKRVVVYSTPTCSWCNTLKTWLNKNNIRYTDIDVSADQRAAEELVRRSGQQGVPQTEIDGRIIVGFDQPRLKELLDIL